VAVLVVMEEDLLLFQLTRMSWPLLAVVAAVAVAMSIAMMVVTVATVAGPAAGMAATGAPVLIMMLNLVVMDQFTLPLNL
jgi:hypothetical protein